MAATIDRDSAAWAARAERAEAAAWADMYAAAPALFGATVERVGAATVLTAPAIPMALFNRVIGLGLDGPVDPAELAAIVHHYAVARVAKYFVHVGPASDPGLGPLLESQGFAPGTPPRWAKMVHGGVSPPHQTELTVRAVSPAEAEPVTAAMAVAHNMPPQMAVWIRALVGRPQWQVFGAFDGAHAVGGGAMWCDGESAWLGIAGTIPAARGRGGQGAVLRARIAAAHALGATLITTETWIPAPGGHNSSLANMERTGFIDVGPRANYEHPTPVSQTSTNDQSQVVIARSISARTLTESSRELG